MHRLISIVYNSNECVQVCVCVCNNFHVGVNIYENYTDIKISWGLFLTLRKAETFHMFSVWISLHL